MEPKKNNANLFKKYTYADSSRNTEYKKRQKIAEYRQIPREDQKNTPVDRETQPPVSEKKSRVRVQLGGLQYNLTAPGKTEEAYLRSVVRRADRVIEQLQASAPGMSMMDLGMLSLINVVDELSQREEYTRKLEDQFSQYVTNSEIEKNNFQKMRELNWEMSKEIQRLKATVDNYEKLMAGETPDSVPPGRLPLEELIEFRQTIEDGEENS